MLALYFATIQLSVYISLGNAIVVSVIVSSLPVRQQLHALLTALAPSLSISVDYSHILGLPFVTALSRQFFFWMLFSSGVCLTVDTRTLFLLLGAAGQLFSMPLSYGKRAYPSSSRGHWAILDISQPAGLFLV